MQTSFSQLPQREAPLADQILCAALDIGEHILRSGGEIHRVEDTIERICTAFGACYVEVFSIPSLIMASVRLEDGSLSYQMRRIYHTENNLYLLEEMNKLSRRLCDGTLPLSELRPAIEKAKSARPYPLWLLYLASALGAGGFAVFFGGTWRDAISGALVGLLLYLLQRHIPPFVNPMINTVIRSFLAGIGGILLVYIGLGQNTDKIMIGTIMLLIPGLELSTAVRDMLGGDLLTGSLRFLQSVLCALMIAFGFALAIFSLSSLV
ncbi:MAG: threonine/serine exporter family protein [Clostridia bacterium]|nr:threonine/serine exporter family protein [Clostridia bacterium]